MLRALRLSPPARLLKQALRCGTVAPLVMGPYGLLRKALDMRGGHYF
jgi:hypothetical protein